MEEHMEYEKLIYKLGSLHSLLRELESERMYQGEHTICYTGLDGVQQTVFIHIDGTDLQMTQVPGNQAGLSLALDFNPEE
jgi:hypothetical protein